jgi:large conductance mechanosensitive channel
MFMALGQRFEPVIRYGLRRGIRVWKEFREFAIKGNVVDLAVGIIIGAAFTTIVTSLVSDVIMPPIGFLLGGIDFSSYYIDLTNLSARAAEAAGSTADAKAAMVFSSLKGAQDAGHAVIAYGKFLNAVINFVIVAFAIFMIVRWINKLKRKEAADPTPAAAPPPADIQLLTEIRDLLAKR